MDATAYSEQHLKVCMVPKAPFGFVHGGAEVQADLTRQQLIARGVSVEWLSLTDTDVLKRCDIVHFFGAEAQWFPWAVAAARVRPIVVSSIFWEPSRLRLAAWHLAGRVRGTTPRLVRSLLALASAVLPNSEAEARQMCRTFDLDANRVHVIPNGVDEDFIGHDPEQFRHKHIADLGESEPFVLSCHRVGPGNRKKTLMLCQAAVQVGVPVVIVGPVLSAGADAETDTVLDYAAKHKSSVRLVGALAHGELPDAYAAASVHALPSDLETPGLASLEAGLNGCNLVVGECPVVREYFDGIAVIVHQDVASIVKGLEQALDMPRNAMNQSAFIRTHYTWRRAAELTEQAYRAAISLDAAASKTWGTC